MDVGVALKGMVRRRKQLSRARVRSATRRSLSRRSVESMPRRAMRALIPACARVHGSSGGRKLCPHEASRACARQRPHGRRIGGMAFIISASSVQSFWLAPGSFAASGMPVRSITTWRFVPSLPRSIGFDPVRVPPFCWDTCAVRSGVGSSGSDRSSPVSRAIHGECAFTCAIRLPFSEPPAGDPRATAHLLWELRSDGRPLRGTKRIPVSACLFGTHLLPPSGRGGSGGKSSSKAVQRSSSSNGLATPSTDDHSLRFVGRSK
jgi:hypothetical protein